MIAATALFHDHTLATRNRRHFEPAGVRIVDPQVSTAGTLTGKEPRVTRIDTDMQMPTGVSALRLRRRGGSRGGRRGGLRATTGVSNNAARSVCCNQCATVRSLPKLQNQIVQLAEFSFHGVETRTQLPRQRRATADGLLRSGDDTRVIINLFAQRLDRRGVNPIFCGGGGCRACGESLSEVAREAGFLEKLLVAQSAPLGNDQIDLGRVGLIPVIVKISDQHAAECKGGVLQLGFLAFLPLRRAGGGGLLLSAERLQIGHCLRGFSHFAGELGRALVEPRRFMFRGIECVQRCLEHREPIDEFISHKGC